MATYVIGDLQGCFEGLQDLLGLIAYQADQDHLIFAGDLINRGPTSLETLLWIMDNPRVHCVLGNHDLHALALLNDCYPTTKNHTLDALLSHKRRDDMMHWLRHQPLIYQHEKAVIVHAGLYPYWSLSQAMSYAEEVQQQLQSDDYLLLLQKMYGNTPVTWQDDLKRWDRLRFIINAFTRMRYLDSQGGLDFTHTGPLGSQPEGYQAWFDHLPDTWVHPIFFGHWASLEGKISRPYVQSLDGGYVWGGEMIALCLETKARFTVTAQSA